MTPHHPAPYKVQLLDCPDLSDGQRTAAELRFRMAIEASLGGPDAVLPTLQAYLLAQMLLNEDPEDLDDDDTASDEPDEGDAEDDNVEAHVIELWESAEAEAITLAMKPLDEAFTNARFQIIPL